MIRETGCSAVMIGRGALGNPWIFEQLSRQKLEPSPAQRWKLVRRHLEDHLNFVGDEDRGIRRFRSHLLWYAHGLRGASAFRRRATQIDRLDELVEHCEAFFGYTAGASSERTEIDFNARQALG